MADLRVNFTDKDFKSPEGIAKLNNILNKILDNLAGNTEDVRIYSGYGSPETVVAAGKGSIYMRLDGGANTSVYIKESTTVNTGWVAK
jgi:hypothetical protein